MATSWADGVSPKPGGFHDLMLYLADVEANIGKSVGMEGRVSRRALDPCLSDALRSIEVEAEAKRQRLVWGFGRGFARRRYPRGRSTVDEEGVEDTWAVVYVRRLFVIGGC